MKWKQKISVIIVVLLFIAWTTNQNIRAQSAGEKDPQKARFPVIFNHDGAIDEYMATVLLQTMEHVNCQGIIITNADCIAGPAMDTAWKIQSFMGKKNIPLALSNARGWNPFPYQYRYDCIRQGKIDALKNQGSPDWPPYPSGEELIIKLLASAVEKKKPVTMLVNCPLTTLCNVLSKHPKLKRGIERLVWMGGAINVAGNLDPKTIPSEIANPKAEWNVFWDPSSAAWIFQNTSFPIILFPLDVTDQASITKEFMAALKAQSSKYKYSRLAYESYHLVVVGGQSYYDMWDVVTTSYLAHPELFSDPVTMNLKIITEGFMQGSIRKVDSGGRHVSVILNLKDPKGFYDYILNQFKR
jgi:purine nucleosidase